MSRYVHITDPSGLVSECPSCGAGLFADTACSFCTPPQKPQPQRGVMHIDVIVSRHPAAVEFIMSALETEGIVATLEPKWLQGRDYVVLTVREDVDDSFGESFSIQKTIPVYSEVEPGNIRGCRVAGNLPLHLAALCRSVYAVEFAGQPPRGQEYGVEEMRAAGARLVEYVVCPAPDLDTPYEVGGYPGTLRDMVEQIRGL